MHILLRGSNHADRHAHRNRRLYYYIATRPAHQYRVIIGLYEYEIRVEKNTHIGIRNRLYYDGTKQPLVSENSVREKNAMKSEIRAWIERKANESINPVYCRSTDWSSADRGRRWSRYTRVRSLTNRIPTRSDTSSHSYGFWYWSARRQNGLNRV